MNVFCQLLIGAEIGVEAEEVEGRKFQVDQFCSFGVGMRESEVWMVRSDILG